MHPVGYLFEDIYRNYWGISPAFRGPEARRPTRSWRNRELLVQPERRQD